MARRRPLLPPWRPPSKPPKANTNQIAVNEMNQNRFTIIQGDINMRAVQLTAYGNPVEGLKFVDIPAPEAPGRSRFSSR